MRCTDIKAYRILKKLASRVGGYDVRPMYLKQGCWEIVVPFKMIGLGEEMCIVVLGKNNNSLLMKQNSPPSHQEMLKFLIKNKHQMHNDNNLVKEDDSLEKLLIEDDLEHSYGD